MAKKKDDQQVSIKVGNIANVSGAVNIAAGNISTRQTIGGMSAAEIKQLFDQVYSAIEARAGTSPADKEDLKSEVQGI